DRERHVSEGAQDAVASLVLDREVLDLEQGWGRHQAPSRSRRPSPKRLNATIVRPSAVPGTRSGHGERNTCWRASRIISPQSAVGGWTPSPRNDRLAPARIANPTRIVASTTTGASTFGSTSPNMM